MGKILGFILFLNIFFLLPQSVNAQIVYDTITGQTINVNLAGRYVSENNYYWAGSTFLSSSTIDVGKIEMKIQVNPPTATTSNNLILRVYKGASTTDREDLSLVGMSLYSYVEYGTSSPIAFDFVTPITFLSNEWYILELHPLSYEDDSFYYLVGGVTTLNNTTENNLSSYNPVDDEFYVSNYASALRMTSYVQDSETQLISLNKPCETTNINEFPCSFGYASTSILEIEGISTSYQSWYTDTYDVYVGLFDTSDMLITYKTITSPVPSEPFNFYTTLEWNDVYENLAQIKVCQVPSNGSTNFNENDCAKVIIGYDLSTASTTEYATNVGFYNEVRKTPDFQKQKDDIWLEYGCDDLGLTDVFPAIQCAFIWAVYPSDESLKKFTRTKSLMLSLYPIGYGTIILDDVTDAFSTTSTSVFDKDIEVKKYFGMSGGTTTISVDHLLSKTGFADPVVDFIETILWLIFGGWLLMFSLTRKL